MIRVIVRTTREHIAEDILRETKRFLSQRINEELQKGTKTKIYKIIVPNKVKEYHLRRYKTKFQNID